jgi:hypothetical protein
LASAHCYDGLALAQNSGTAPVAADLYRVQCYKASVADGSDGGATVLSNTTKLIAVVNSHSGSAVSVRIAREGFTPSAVYTDSTPNATNWNATTCLAPGAPTNFNQWAVLNPTTVAQGSAANGNGDYNILVTKATTAAATYGLAFHCQDTGTAHTGTREVHSGSAAPELTGNTAVSPDIDILIDG